MVCLQAATSVVWTKAFHVRDVEKYHVEYTSVSYFGFYLLDGFLDSISGFDSSWTSLWVVPGFE